MNRAHRAFPRTNQVFLHTFASAFTSRRRWITGALAVCYINTQYTQSVRSGVDAMLSVLRSQKNCGPGWGPLVMCPEINDMEPCDLEIKIIHEINANGFLYHGGGREKF